MNDIVKDELRGMSDWLAEIISEKQAGDRIIPLDQVGQFAYVELETSMIWLITIQEARLVPASNQDSSPDGSS